MSVLMAAKMTAAMSVRSERMREFALASKSIVWYVGVRKQDFGCHFPLASLGAVLLWQVPPLGSTCGGSVGRSVDVFVHVTAKDV